MGSRPYLPFPLTMVSTRSVPLLRVSTVASIARSSRVRAVELDLRGRRLPDADKLAAQVEQRQSRIHALWLPPRSAGRGRQRERERAAIAEFVTALHVPILVAGPVPITNGTISRAAMIEMTEALRSSVPTSTRVSLVLSPHHLEAGRLHLVQMTALRRLAEEWDFDIALDLLGSPDPGWEAEAAVMRLGSKLTTMRFSARLGDRPPVGLARVTRRAVHAALDTMAPPVFSLAPSLLPWQRLSAPMAADACASTRQYLMDRHASFRKQHAAHPHPNFQPETRT